MIADVGQPETLRQLGVHSKRVPQFVLPDHNLLQGYIVAHNVASDKDLEQIRNKLRPDTMIVKMSAVEYSTVAVAKLDAN